MIVFLTKDPGRGRIETGRERLSRDLLGVLRKAGGRVSVRSVSASVRTIPKLVNGLRGYLDGGSPAAAEKVARELTDAGADTLFVDGSNYGRLAERIKKRLPAVRVITCFHNCETAFFWGSLKSRRSLKAALILFANFLAERSAVRYSDDVVTLTERDSDSLKTVYGRGATSIFPMFLSSREKPSISPPYRLQGGEDYVLFVGGAFYANLRGATWFAREVSPYLELKTLIVGAGFEGHRSKLEKHKNVHVVGAVQDLAPFYAGAKLVVAPIFEGSGMKTKVAEALMFQKVVVGTRQALAGYEQGIGSVCIECETAKDFVQAIEAIVPRAEELGGQALTLFNSEFSEAAAEARMKALLSRGLAGEEHVPERTSAVMGSLHD